MKNRLLSICLLIILLLPLVTTAIPVQAQEDDAVTSLIRSLTPEQKVGQLFLISFKGTDTSPESQIYDLLVNRYIGGVVLTAANDNFVAAPDTAGTPGAAFSLNKALQQTNWEGARNPESPTRQHPYIPLFIGISQEGGGYPNDQILSGLTPFPSQMAIGAAWDRALAEELGQAMGRELSSLGFNLYFGLSLDVLQRPNLAANIDLGTRVFGGSPYWVGEMGRSFISGLHKGSANRLAVIAQHFPGRGSADRPADLEVPTVRSSLEELKQIELAPFFDVTGEATSPETAVDGVLVSHARYQGFQGNIRANTPRPISFDQQALGQVLALPQVQPWWRSGGLVVSDDLGLQAVRRFFDPDNTSFSPRLVASNAFLAGNDLLYMGNITASDAPDNYATIVRSLDFFAQKYREDPAFAIKVDESLRRILTVKYRLYPSFSLSTVLPGPLPQNLGSATNSVFTIARQSATLISPPLSDLPSVLPSPPNALDYIVFLTDLRYSRQCTTCPDVEIIPVDAFQNAVMRLYGPSAAGLAATSHLSSYSFADISLFLQETPSENLVSDLNQANIVVISALDLPAGQSEVEILRRFLSEKQSLLAGKKVLMFSFGAPYYLDATDISRLDAYYGMYSPSAPFVEAAARLLFQEISPLGSPPVSIPGTGYSLETATSPDPDQVISLRHDSPSVVLPPTAEASATSGSPITPTAKPSLTPTATPPPVFKQGDTIAIHTGVILDRNKHPVPDGTLVRFVLSQENGLMQQVETATTGGVAGATFRLDQLGPIRIVASSGQARVSDIIGLNVNNNEGGVPVIISPTLEPTPFPTDIPPTPEPTKPASITTTSAGYPTFLGWFLALLFMVGGAALAYWLGLQFAEARWAARWALLAFLGGLAAYNYLVLEMPGSLSWLEGRGLPAFLQAIILGQIVGFVGGWFWRLTSQRGNQAQEQ